MIKLIIKKNYKNYFIVMSESGIHPLVIQVSPGKYNKKYILIIIKLILLKKSKIIIYILIYR